MLIVGIDPGLATTGYGFIEKSDSDDIKVIDYGIVSTPAKTPVEKRLLFIHQEIRRLLNLHCPQQAAVEKLFFQRNTTTAMSVSQARGVILLAMAEFGLPISEYTPLEIKLAVAGYGGAGKRQIQEMVRMILEIEEIPRPDDAADALAVAICHCNHFNRHLLIDSNI